MGFPDTQELIDDIIKNEVENNLEQQDDDKKNRDSERSTWFDTEKNSKVKQWLKINERREKKRKTTKMTCKTLGELDQEIREENKEDDSSVLLEYSPYKRKGVNLPIED